MQIKMLSLLACGAAFAPGLALADDDAPGAYSYAWQDSRLKSEIGVAQGNEFDPARCNTFDTHVRRTTPIGVFPRGDTAARLADMTGNVWEWTSSAYREYPYDSSDGREDATRDDARRVARGGSWRSFPVSARAASRAGLSPDDRSYSVGFRVVCVSPIR